MNYIYDILVNFDGELLDFFEWNKNDNIEHIRKIPIFKVTTDKYKDFKKNIVQVDNNFLKLIKSKTEIFLNNKINYIDYSCIITDGMDLVVIEFDKDGYGILKSSMLLDEADDTIDESESISITEINYNVIKVFEESTFSTRKERNIKKYLNNEINKIIKNNNENKLKYLYYEYYNKISNDIEEIQKGLKNIMNIEFNDKHNKLYNILKLVNTKKQI